LSILWKLNTYSADGKLLFLSRVHIGMYVRLGMILVRLAKWTNNKIGVKGSLDVLLLHRIKAS